MTCIKVNCKRKSESDLGHHLFLKAFFFFFFSVCVNKFYPWLSYIDWFSVCVSVCERERERIIIIMEICKAPTLRLKALNKHTHIMYIEMENVINK